LGILEGKIRPGQSHNLTFDVKKIVWKCFVCPGVFDTLTTYLKEGIKLLQITTQITKLYTSD